jgi:tRNA threonylcarbamoyl adenosine modification protein YeaZ
LKILAIDTSSKICSVSILENENVIIEKHNDDEKTHSQKLMPIIDETFKQANLSLDDIDLLACCQGPGSFTGIRIGISTVKAFADVKNIPIIGVTSLEALCYNINRNGLIASIIDAKHDNVYFGLFKFENNNLVAVETQISCPITSAIEILKKHSNEEITLVGDGTIEHHNLLQTELTNIKFAQDAENLQTSISIGLAALSKYNNSNYSPTYSVSPIYLKKSEAEINLELKNKMIKGD